MLVSREQLGDNHFPNRLYQVGSLVWEFLLRELRQNRHHSPKAKVVITFLFQLQVTQQIQLR